MKGTVAIVGVGYVGFSLAMMCFKKGYNVIGIDINRGRNELINRGTCPFKDDSIKRLFESIKPKILATDDYSAIKNADIIVVSVPTPLKSDKTPDLSYITFCTKSLIEHVKSGTVIIMESSVYPGACRNLIKPMIENGGFRIGADLFLAVCPERVDFGNKKFTISNTPRVVGALDSKSLDMAANFYNSVLDVPVTKASCAEVAEASKLIENCFRDVNIAFVNEIAILFDKLGIDLVETIKCSSTKPFGYMPFFPSCGVGGSCIPINPYYLMKIAEDAKGEIKSLKLSRSTNDSMPYYMVEKIEKCISMLGGKTKETELGVLGLTYKGNTDDLRESPAIKIVEILKNKGVKLRIYDPYVPNMSNVNSLDSALDAECVIILSDHDVFKKIDFSKYPKIKLIVDGKNCLDKHNIGNKVYDGIGNPSKKINNMDG
jgi:UDP-N-acetyl-D-glucosamine dehydrogenase